MAKGKTRKNLAAKKAAKRANKKAGINKPSGHSKYGEKHRLQAAGKFSERSPFEMGKPDVEAPKKAEQVPAPETAEAA